MPLIINEFPTELPAGDYGLDIETTYDPKRGANPFEDRLLIVSVSDGNTSWVLTQDFGRLVWFLESDKHVKIVHNGIFDIPFLRQVLLCKPKMLYDTLLIERLLNAGVKISNGLDAVVARRCAGYLNKETRKEFQRKLFTVVTKDQIKYSEGDVIFLPEIKRQQVLEINEQNLGKVARLEMDCQYVFHDMYLRGINFDLELWNEYLKWINEYLEKLVKKIEKIIPNGKVYQDSPYHFSVDVRALIREEFESLDVEDKTIYYKEYRAKGFSVDHARLSLLWAHMPFSPALRYRLFFNPNSPTQVTSLVEDIIKEDDIRNPHIIVKDGVRTIETTSSQFLDEYIREYDDRLCEVFELLKEWREWSKLRGWGYDQYVNPATGKIHPSWNQLGTDTGRISSGGRGDSPNMQNVTRPREDQPNMRKLFIPQEGYSFVVADYGQQEGRILAQISKDARMLEAANREDLYAGMAEVLYGTRDVTTDQRHYAKTVFLAMSYGAGAGKVAKTLNVPLDRAVEVVNTFNQAFITAMRWGEAQYRRVRQEGFTTTLYGRKRFFPDINERMDEGKEKHMQNQCRNTPIQGTGADIMKLAMVNIHKAIIGAGLDAHVLMQIHDEVVVEVRDDQADAVKTIVETNMKLAMEMLCPDVMALVEATVGKEWTH